MGAVLTGSADTSDYSPPVQRYNKKVIGFVPGFNQTMLLHRLYLWLKHRKSRVSLSSRGTNRVSSSIPTDKVPDESFNLKCSYTRVCVCVRVYTRQFLRADKYEEMHYTM